MNCVSGNDVNYVFSARGTQMIYYQGNTYVPNEKVALPNRKRNWKCSMYFKEKCRARVTTKNGRLEVPVPNHTHLLKFASIDEARLLK